MMNQSVLMSMMLVMTLNQVSIIPTITAHPVVIVEKIKEGISAHFGFPKGPLAMETQGELPPVFGDFAFGESEK